MDCQSATLLIPFYRARHHPVKPKIGPQVNIFALCLGALFLAGMTKRQTCQHWKLVGAALLGSSPSSRIDSWQNGMTRNPSVKSVPDFF
jgi:hypothetical protein